MKCHHCHKNEATVHLVEMTAGRRRDLWLCAECAEAEQWRRLDSVGEPGSDAHPPADFSAPDSDSDDYDAMLRLLGQSAPHPDNIFPDAVCTECGYTWKEFQASGKVGCGRCYVAFRQLLLPMLAAFHRHPTHLGRVPGARTGGGNFLVEISRLRVGLEKAIAAEKFEEAALLRDQLRDLENRLGSGGEHGSG